MNIPKIIHYIWVGNNPKPEIIQKCIASWAKYMPDYEIKEWNESNYDVNKCRYIREAYAEKKWAFVSDFMRFDILNQYGGIYFDTDVELLKPIPGSVLENSLGFTAMESTGKVSPGLIFASVPGHPFLKEILDVYRVESFIVNGKNNLTTVNQRTTAILSRYGFVQKNEFQKADGLEIYPSNIFCGYDLDINEYAIVPETISVHHYAGSWTSPRQAFFRKAKNLVKHTVGIDNYRKILVVKRKLFGVHGESRSGK